MDPPPSLPPLATTTTAAAPITATSIHLNYPDSQESSPRSHNVESYENDPLPPVPGAKLRLMCSYGGHIIPRPHDKSLCYVGGETRLVVVDRHSSLSFFSTRLSCSLLNGRSFALKYQLPNEDLDSLVSLTTDEDLENMIEEYDRLLSSSTRIRLFIFFNKPETAASMGSLLDDAKSETWFVDALNGSGLLPRGLSDTTMDCLLNLDSENDLEAQTDHDGNLNRQHANLMIRNNLAVVHDVQYSLPDSPVVETTSSVGSSSSSPSMSNLPPIRVRVEEHSRQIMEEQFAQMSFASVVRVQEDHGGVYGPSGGLPPPVPVGLTGGVSHGDDERSDSHGGSVGVNRLRKPPLPLQAVQHKASSAYNSPSPDSVASDNNIASTNSVSKQMYYQDQVACPPRENRAPSPSSPNTDPDNLPPIPTPQIQDSAYNNMPPQLDPQQQQQQYVHYITHQATTPVPISSYYHPIYPPQQQQLHHPIDQQYPVYHVMPVTQTQPYMSMHSNIADTSVAASSRLPPAYNKDTTPTVYPTNRTAAAPAVIATPPPPPLVQIPGSQFQQQYVAAGVGYAQMQHPSHQANYGTYNEYGNNIPAHHDQVYYTTTTTQHQAPAPLPPQYQTMSPAAVAAFTDASKQLPVDTTTQQIRTSQPI
ncbi:hypothetical protein Dsin_005116 [Dipteronia sinensis]|uniref:PB1 domain-containing protein n=1 Tax=Dipteronia sinensis TaxID=43782 RepID=A0AAE0AX75_9ROSI|nr:hypothetical protein Dsin_005116 [Dipteronia sinensis]